ncbi:MAG: 6,7-dimethyl-8-ribityllumazine synthase [Actinomycetota bacterium]|jgi:6,7-dimethyl-8-ribityllumazine synthase|nr:6,7-dimethyl-8-ribityllumazine synthase [Actinomycetota bacterium]
MSPRTYEGSFEAKHLRVAIIASRFNEAIVERLVEGAVECLGQHGVPDEYITTIWVPGAFELPVTALRVASSGEFDAVVCVGAVVRGDTPHFDFVAGAAAQGITSASLQTGIPIALGVLTTDTLEQAEERAGGRVGNKGFESALAAIEMANLFESLPKPRTDI